MLRDICFPLPQVFPNSNTLPSSRDYNSRDSPRSDFSRDVPREGVMTSREGVVTSREGVMTSREGVMTSRDSVKLRDPVNRERSFKETNLRHYDRDSGG